MKFSTSDMQLLKTVISNTPIGSIYEPNLYESEKEYMFSKMINDRLWGKERYPGKFKRLELIRESHMRHRSKDLSYRAREDEFDSLCGLFEAGKSALSSSFSASGFGTVVGGFHAMDLTIIVSDNKTSEFIAINNSMAINDVYLDTSVSADLGDTSGDFTVLLRCTFDPSDGTEPRELYSKLEINTGITKAADPTLDAPKRTCNNPQDPGSISIGLGRPYTDQGGNTGLDYAWNQPSQNHPRGMIPFVGQARFDKPIMPLKPKRNFVVQMAVVNMIAGGHFQIDPQNMDNVYSRFSIDPSDNHVLKWNFQPGKTTSDPGNPVVFGNVNWPADMRAIFFFKALVFLQDGVPAIVTVRSYEGAQPNPVDGHLPIMPIRFVWHCLAENTEVVMSDGTVKPIQDIIAGDKVKSNVEGESSEVLWTTKGIHQGFVYEIQTESGGSVTASDGHIFITETGSCSAGELRVGEKLFSYSPNEPNKLEPTEITQIKRIRGYNDLMYNIATRGYEESSYQIGTFFANNVCVGDVNSSEVIVKANNKNIGYLKSIVPAIYHKDIESYFEDKLKEI